MPRCMKRIGRDGVPRQILSALSGRPMSRCGVAQLVGRGLDATRATLNDLRRSGFVVCENYLYRLTPSGEAAFADLDDTEREYRHGVKCPAELQQRIEAERRRWRAETGCVWTGNLN